MTDRTPDGPEPRTHGDRVRAELLARAVAVLQRDGLKAFSLNRFAKEVGTTARMVVHYFGSKDGLLAEVLRDMVRADAMLPAAVADDVAGVAEAVFDLYQGPGVRVRLDIYFHLVGSRVATSDTVVSDAFDRREFLGMWSGVLERSGAEADAARQAARQIQALGAGVMAQIATGQMSAEEARHHYVNAAVAIASKAVADSPSEEAALHGRTSMFAIQATEVGSDQ